jgi:hypothetical protein
MVRFAWSVALLGLAALVSQAVAAQGARQQYGPWQYNKEKNYYYREYQYKVKANDKEYQHEYCIYFKDDAKVNNKWVYFYNPKTEKFWARYPTVNNETYKKYAEKGKEAWSELPGKYRQKDIYQIDAKTWPAPKTDYCPTIPAATDGALMKTPPADLP